MLEVVEDESAGERGDLVRSLFEAHYGDLVGLASLILGDAAGGEDVVQECFAELYGRIAPLDDPAGGVGYLRRSVVNRARSRLRRRRVENRPRPLSLVGRTSVEDVASASDDAAVVAAAVARLPLRQRECVVAHHYLGLSHPEIAELLGISVGSVKTHLHRASRRLAELLKDYRHG